MSSTDHLFKTRSFSDAGTQSDAFAGLREKIRDKSLTVGVIGLGYVGVPLITAVTRRNIQVIGFDISERRVGDLIAGTPYLKGMEAAYLKSRVENDLLSATTDIKALAEADVILICVPTPLIKNQLPDMGYVEGACRKIAEILRPGQMVILESTVYPGATAESVAPILAETGLVENLDFFVAYSPEREDPGNKEFHTAVIPKVVGADHPDVTALAAEFYELFIASVKRVSSSRAAEAAKLLENIFRSVNIGLINELKIVLDRMGIDIWQVIDAAATKPFGFMPFYPGPGIGGHCIPIDPLYLTWKSGEGKVETRFIRTATEINANMPRYVVERLALALDDRFAKGLNGARLLIVGLAYKKNTDDLRESPASEVVSVLKQRKARLSYYEPLVNEAEVLASEFKGLTRCDASAESLAGYDAVLILTDHDDIDWAFIVNHAKLVYDSRNATKNVTSGREKIVT